jgi:hypothetical protein
LFSVIILTAMQMNNASNEFLYVMGATPGLGRLRGSISNCQPVILIEKQDYSNEQKGYNNRLKLDETHIT